LIHIFRPAINRRERAELKRWDLEIIESFFEDFCGGGSGDDATGIADAERTVWFAD